MKTIGAHLSHFLENKELQRNLPLLFKFLFFVAVVIAIFSVLFHVLMVYEGQQHTWITGLYWTLTVMSTLGFGDITFTTDLGRFFSVIVLVTGIVLLLVVLPFAFIRFFYAPWLEEQIRMRAPRELPPDTEGHVIICSPGPITPGLIKWLERSETPYAMIVEDPGLAAELHVDGLSVVVGEVDDKETYERLRVNKAALIVANIGDIDNTNIILTIREYAPDVPIAAISHDENAVDILELSGATHVLPLKRWLGEQLANRINAKRAGLHPIGEISELKIAEMPVHGTPLVGKTIRETKLREETGVNAIGVWERGPLQTARPSTSLTEASVLLVVGSSEQLESLDSFLSSYDVNPNPVLIIGGGTVGAAAASALAKRDVPVNLVEKDVSRTARLMEITDHVFEGDASNYDLLSEAGIAEAPSVLLTTNDDAVNIFLTSYCRRLNPELRIVTRITHERNLAAIYRAGADFVLSYATLGVDSILSIIKKKKLVVLGEGVDLFSVEVPPSLYGKSLAESGIGAVTGLNVIAIKDASGTHCELSPSFKLKPRTELVMIGSTMEFEKFNQTYD